jgi:hypothetical protein
MSLRRAPPPRRTYPSLPRRVRLPLNELRRPARFLQRPLEYAKSRLSTGARALFYRPSIAGRTLPRRSRARRNKRAHCCTAPSAGCCHSSSTARGTKQGPPISTQPSLPHRARFRPLATSCLRFLNAVAAEGPAGKAVGVLHRLRPARCEAPLPSSRRVRKVSAWRDDAERKDGGGSVPVSRPVRSPGGRGGAKAASKCPVLRRLPKARCSSRQASNVDSDADRLIVSAQETTG